MAAYRARQCPRDGDEIPPSHHALGRPQPLLGATHATGLLAGSDRAAQAAFDDRELGHVATTDRRERLVEVGHAVVDQA
jgi:hypothetical protein